MLSSTHSIMSSRELISPMIPCPLVLALPDLFCPDPTCHLTFVFAFCSSGKGWRWHALASWEKGRRFTFIVGGMARLELGHLHRGQWHTRPVRVPHDAKSEHPRYRLHLGWQAEPRASPYIELRVNCDPEHVSASAECHRQPELGSLLG